jgi:hypothetical protein
MQKNLFSEENLPVLKALQKNLPNDMEFGRELRKSFRDYPFVIALFNDQDLGREVRKFLIKQK